MGKGEGTAGPFCSRAGSSVRTGKAKASVVPFPCWLLTTSSYHSNEEAFEAFVVTKHTSDLFAHGDSARTRAS